MYILRFLVIFIFSIQVLIAKDETPEIIRAFDATYYRPQHLGVTDLVFKMRISGLTEKLNERKVFGKLKDVYFKIYYASQKEILVEVYGMPKGFRQVKDELIRMASSRLDFIFPQSIQDRFKNFEFSLLSNKGVHVFKGIDPKYMDDISEILLYMGQNSQLTKLIIKRPTGIETAHFEFGKRPWSQNKWALLNLKVESMVGGQLSQSEFDLEYKIYNGHGLPSKIVIKTGLQIQRPAEKANDNFAREMKTTLEFSDYEVNAGSALKYLRAIQ